MSAKRGRAASSGLWKAALPVAVAFLSAGSAPWWGPPIWNRFFPPPHMGELHWGQNYQGSDIADIDRPEVNTAGECSALCEKHPRCEAMTFVLHFSRPGGVCWLKDSVPALIPNPQMVSARKIHP